MSEDNKCRCGHNYTSHTFEEMENGKVCDCFHCKECGKDQNGNFECKGFCRVGSLPPEFRARIKSSITLSKENEARIKAENDARKKEKERLEKEQKEKERLEKEQKFKKEHEIQSLFHICHIDNLSSIIEKGLFSRIRAREDDCKFVDIADQGISGRRDEYNEKLGLRLTTFASTYFEPMNGMYWRVIPNEKNEEGIIIKRFPEKIVIVEFKIDLSKEGIVITDGNAAEGDAVKTSYDDHSFVKIMSEIQEETINLDYQGEKRWSSVLEWEEHKRRKAAECLVPKKISRDCITSIHVYNDPETISTATHLKDNSGLRINLKTIDKWQMRIKRE